MHRFMRPDSPYLPQKEDILSARRAIAPFIHKTPVLRNSGLDAMLGCSIFFKCENFQKAGSFKMRGATNTVLSADQKQANFCVATHSSGNHAQALSLAARNRGIKAYIVMPENAPKVKVSAVQSYGGHITFCKPTLQDRESTLKEVLTSTGALEIHPYNDYRIIAGQSTVAAELFEQTDPPDFLLVPVGGGGLLSGSILAARHLSPGTRVIAAEPLMANDAWRSFTSGAFVPSENPDTIADGLRTSLGSLTYPIIMNGVHDMLTVTEEGIKKAMLLILERMKLVVEPSGAVPLAAMMEHQHLFVGKRIGVILSGGNVDLKNLPL